MKGGGGREGKILCDDNYGVGAYGMEWMHYKEPEQSCIKS